MEKLARQIEAVIRTVPGTTSAYAERVIGGYYLNIDPDRAQLSRYGLMVGDLQNLIAMALGAEPVTTTVEGRERYTVLAERQDSGIPSPSLRSSADSGVFCA
jgi:Cu(I)/Ag(I) efflux system membrane protein CusA/SilA